MQATVFKCCALLAGTLFVASSATAATLPSTLPAADDVVATQLLPRTLKDSLRHLAVTAPADDPAQRFAAARRMIETGRSNGDPRTLGYAEALLAPWPADAGATPLDAVVLYATIAQSRHDFARAGVLLDRVLERSRPGDPAYAQALLTRATIRQVTGQLRPARSDCEQLFPVAREAAAVCAASVDMVAGRLDGATGVLRIASVRTAGAVQAWALAVLAQANEQRGETGAATTAYRSALSAGDDLVTRLAFADHLIATNQATAAATVLKDAPPTDGVVLRQWRCARVLRENAPALEEALQTRLTNARQRGDGSDLLHARDWALFELERGHIADALRMAQANWRVQREPADLLILARAAVAARDVAVKAEVRNWLVKTKLQDLRIETALREEQ